MKIISQLLNTSSNVAVKTSSSADNGMEFHSALTVAAAAKGVGESDPSQVKAKPVTQETKPQAQDRKKDVTAGSSVSNVSVPVAAAVTQVPANIPVQFALASPQSDEASQQAADHSSSDLQLASGSIGRSASFSSLRASIASPLVSATNAMSINGIGHKASNGILDSVAQPLQTSVLLADNSAQDEVAGSLAPSGGSSAQTSNQSPTGFDVTSSLEGGTGSPSSTVPSVEPIVAQSNSPAPTGEAALDGQLEVASSSGALTLPMSNGAQAQISNSNTSHPDVKTAQAMQVPTAPVTPTSVPVLSSAPVVPISEPTIAKTGPAVQGAESSKRVDTSSSASSVKVVDSATQATPQVAVSVAAAQNIVAPISPSNFVPANATPSMSTSTVESASSGNTIVENIEGGASRQTASSTKAKPGAATSDLHGKSAADSDSETQTASTSVSTVPFAAKVPATAGVLNQGASEPGITGSSAALQQATQAIQPDASSHTPQTSQSVSSSEASAVQTLPAQAPQETLATQGVSSAQLIQSMRSSEMKLGMQSAEFGSISINTSLNHQALSAQISFDHLELGKALAVHLPAIEEKLGSAYGVQAKVELRDSNNPSSSNESGYSNSGQQSKEQRQSQGAAPALAQGGMFGRITPTAVSTTVSPTASASRLDIRI